MSTHRVAVRLISLEFLVVGELDVDGVAAQLGHAGGEVSDHRGSRHLVRHLQKRLQQSNMLTITQHGISLGEQQQPGFDLPSYERRLFKLSKLGKRDPLTSVKSPPLPSPHFVVKQTFKYSPSAGYSMATFKLSFK